MVQDKYKRRWFSTAKQAIFEGVGAVDLREIHRTRARDFRLLHTAGTSTKGYVSLEPSKRKQR